MQSSTSIKSISAHHQYELNARASREQPGGCFGNSSHLLLPNFLHPFIRWRRKTGINFDRSASPPCAMNPSKRSNILDDDDPMMIEWRKSVPSFCLAHQQVPRQKSNFNYSDRKNRKKKTTSSFGKSISELQAESLNPAWNVGRPLGWWLHIDHSNSILITLIQIIHPCNGMLRAREACLPCRRLSE